MQTLVVYDIPSDKLRTKIADICLDYGLERIQFSVFFGTISDNRREELTMKLSKRLGKQEGGIQIFVICEKDLRVRRQLGNPPHDASPPRAPATPSPPTGTDPFADPPG